MRMRRIAVTLAAVVLVAGVVAGRERPTLELIQESATESTRARAAQADDGIDLDRLQRGESAAPKADPFALKADPAPKETRQAVREKPAAPPLPFQYFGRITENGKTEVFLMRGEELLSVAPGQTLGEYRVDQVGAGSIAFTYLPLKTKQTLDFQ